jgi:cytochrome c
MFDTMTLTKMAAAFCGSLLVFLLGAWAADELYHVGGSHGYGDHSQAYTIDTGEGDAVEEVVEEGPDFSVILASADPASGEKVFGKCKACHKLEAGANGTGPYLYGVVGRPIGAADGFGYSSAMGSHGDTWTPDNLNAFLENPKGWVQGTSMSFNGLRKVEERADLIAYLQTIGN